MHNREQSTKAVLRNILFWEHSPSGEHAIAHKIIEEVNVTDLFKVSRFCSSWEILCWQIIDLFFTSSFSNTKTSFLGKILVTPSWCWKKFQPPHFLVRQKCPSWGKFLSLPSGWESIRLSPGWRNITDTFSQELVDCYWQDALTTDWEYLWRPRKKAMKEAGPWIGHVIPAKNSNKGKFMRVESCYNSWPQWEYYLLPWRAQHLPVEYWHCADGKKHVIQRVYWLCQGVVIFQERAVTTVVCTEWIDKHTLTQRQACKHKPRAVSIKPRQQMKELHITSAMLWPQTSPASM